ncbi:FAD-dependent oxidoreductase [Kaarinaea lacus]
MANIVIVGAGLAGYTLAKELRKIDEHSGLHIITADDGHFYSKPMLSNALAKNKTAETLVSTSAAAMAGQLNATIWSNTRVDEIDNIGKQVHAGGKTAAYDKLVLALGAEQIQPPLQGDAVSEVLTVNNLQDYARFRRELENATHVAVIGPGLIGCEFANDIVESGRQVTVIGPGNTPLNRLLPEEAGKALQNKLSQLGVQWRLGVTAEQVNKIDTRFSVGLSNGDEVQADLVLSSIGLRPNVALAEQCGAQTNRGIVVNRLLQTSVENIFAIGDCAEIEGLVLPFVLPIMHSARALAKTLCGEDTPISFPAMPVVVKTPAHAVVVSPPSATAQGQWNVTVEEGGVRALFQDAERKLLGFVLTGASVAEKQKLTKELPPVL